MAWEDPPEDGLASLAHTVEDGYSRMWSQYARLPTTEVHKDFDAMWYLTGLADPYFNGVVRARFGHGSADRRIDEILARFREKGMPLFWFVGPTSQPEDLAARLRARGFVPYGDMVGMALDLRALPPGTSPLPGVTIEAVHDPRRLAEWVQVVAEGFGSRPGILEGFIELEAGLGIGPKGPWVRYVARAGGRPVTALALLFMGEVAGLENVATIPEARRRGFASLLTHHALHAAQARNCRLMVLGASPIGARVYRRLGFREVCPLGFFIRESPP